MVFRLIFEIDGQVVQGKGEIISQHSPELLMGFTGSEKLPREDFLHGQQQELIAEQPVELFFKKRFSAIFHKQVENARLQGGQANKAVKVLVLLHRKE